MFCNKCGNSNTRVIDSRSSDDCKSIRRRRECENCENRFTTFEKVEVVNLIVEKSGNRKQRYNRDKLEDSLLKALNKRNKSTSVINSILSDLEQKWNAKSEITSKQIGKDILEILKGIDEVAYIRYASVYLNFECKQDFIEFISK